MTTDDWNWMVPLLSFVLPIPIKLFLSFSGRLPHLPFSSPFSILLHFFTTLSLCNDYTPTLLASQFSHSLPPPLPPSTHLSLITLSIPFTRVLELFSSSFYYWLCMPISTPYSCWLTEFLDYSSHRVTPKFFCVTSFGRAVVDVASLGALLLVIYD